VVLLALHCRVRLLSRVWVVACRWDSEPCVSLSRTRTRDERWPEQIEATFFFVEKRDCFDLIDAAGKSRLCFAGRWAAAKETIAPAPLPAGHRRAVEKREASRKFRFGESKASQAADTPLSLSLSLSCTVKQYNFSLYPLSLFSSVVTRFCLRLCPRKDSQPARGQQRGERGKASRVASAPPSSPFAPIGAAASREIRSAFPAAARARWLEVSAAPPTPLPIGAAPLPFRFCPAVSQPVGSRRGRPVCD
jgi:hypothetical protein